MADVKIMTEAGFSQISIPGKNVLIYNDQDEMMILCDGEKSIQELTKAKIIRLQADPEFKKEKPVKEPEPTAVLGDVNGDGKVDNEDLSILMTEKNKASKGKKKPKASKGKKKPKKKKD